MVPLTTLTRGILLGITAAGVVAAARAPRARVPEDPTPEGQSGPLPDSGEGPSGTASLAGQNPFRADRRPTSPRYLAFDPNEGRETDEVEEPPTPRPEWTLTGVLWGARPIALFEGIPPELSSGILTQGDSVGPIHVERITPDTVYLRGTAASWAFTIETPWKTGRGS